MIALSPLIRPMPVLETSPLEFDANGVPYSARYADSYHAAQGGLAQFEHVFLNGCELPRRWQGQPHFTIVETGFGLGLNFLATWQAWRTHPQRPRRLHFVSTELHPHTTDALRQVHRNTALETLAEQLADRLQTLGPQPVTGLHRFAFEDGCVQLTLGLGDAQTLLDNLRLGADAFFLDGFAPSRNPAMWSPQLFKALARLAHQGATLATWSVAGAVQRGLSECGFEVRDAPGFAGKRAMTVARFSPRYRVRRHEPPGAAVVAQPDRPTALIIGAGLAGGACAASFAARGWQVHVLEAGPQVAGGASAHHAAGLQPALAADHSRLMRLTVAGVNGALLHWPTQPASDDTPRWQACGALRLFADATTKGVPPDAQALLRAGGVAGLQWLTLDQASEVARLALASGGLWLPDAAWARPVQLIAAWLDHPAIQTHCLAQVVSLTRQSDQSHAVTATGQEVRADVVVLANGQHALPLLAVLGGSPNAMPLPTVRGQTTHLADPGLQPLRCILSGQGYVLPSVAGTTVIGSSYQPDRQDTAIDPADHESNLGQAQAMLPAWQPPLNNAALTGHAALRVIVPDRLPMIGALPHPDPWHSTPAPKVPGSLHLREWPRHPGLYIATAYGSRGLTWAWLGAEVIASLACGEPPPIEADLLDAIDPARFVLREARRG